MISFFRDYLPKEKRACPLEAVLACPLEGVGCLHDAHVGQPGWGAARRGRREALRLLQEARLALRQHGPPPPPPPPPTAAAALAWLLGRRQQSPPRPARPVLPPAAPVRARCRSYRHRPRRSRRTAVVRRASSRATARASFPVTCAAHPTCLCCSCQVVAAASTTGKGGGGSKAAKSRVAICRIFRLHCSPV